MDSSSSSMDYTEEHMKILLQCLSKWTKMIEYLKPDAEPDDGGQFHHRLIEQIHDVESLQEQINHIVSPLSSSQCHNVANEEDLTRIFNLLADLKIFTESLKQSLLKLGNNNNGDDNGQSKTGSRSRGGRLLLRLSLISSHLNAVVGLHKLLMSAANCCTGEQKQPSSSAAVPVAGTPFLLSSNEESLIRLSICHSLRLTFGPFLIGTGYFNADQLDRLFPTTSLAAAAVTEEEDKEDIEMVLRPIYLIYVQMFLLSTAVVSVGTVFQLAFLNDCLPILLAIYAIFKAAANPSSIENKKDHYANIIEERFTESHFQNEKIRPFVIRNLLLLLAAVQTANQNANRFRSIIANMIRNHLTGAGDGHPGGLELLIDATLDSDLLSQRDTTVQHRIQAMVTLVVYLPVKNHSVYYAKLLEQAVGLLAKDRSTASHPPEVYWTFSAMLVEAIDSQNRQLTHRNFFNFLEQSLRQQQKNLDLSVAVRILHRMVSRRRCLKRLSPFFPPIFYMRFSLEQTICHVDVKDECWRLLVDMMAELPASEYVLDDCLGQLQRDRWIGHFVVDLENERVRYVDKGKEEDLLDETNKLATFTLKLLDQTSMAFRLNFFYLLLERLIDSQPSPVILFLVGPFAEKIFGATVTRKEEEERENILRENERTVQFLTATMERIVKRLLNVQDQCPMDENQDQQPVQIWTETLSMCLKILVILLDSGQKSATLMKQLKPCHESLSMLLNSSRALAMLNAMDSTVAHELYAKFEKLNNTSNPSTAGSCDNGPLDMVLKDLRSDDYMPSRVHALVTLKRMILARDLAVEVRFDEVLHDVRQILKDAESYVYLAAIKTLVAMAIRRTDQVLPVLIQELVGDTNPRPLADRLKIGEVLLQLAHSIGDFAYHYSEQFIHGLLCGVKSPEPAVRISALSCLGEFCRQFRFGLDKYIVELVSMAERILATDPEMDCRRAAAAFLYHLLAGVDRSSAMAIQDHLKPIKDLILDIGQRTLDDVLQRHCQMAYGELSRIAREFINLDF